MQEPDITLLKQYACGDESAFKELFERYVYLVYSAALRQVRNPSHAEEITQAVFILLARKAKSLSPKTVLSGWLYQATRLTAASLIKREIRRQRREREVYMQSLTEPEASSWEQIAPLLDDAMGRLGEQDRNAIVLRFFENRTPQEVAGALKLNEVAARKRVSRALEKLRNFFAKRGVVLTTTIIAAAISGNSVQAAPIALANSAVAVAIAKGAMASTSTLTLIKGALKIMAWTKMKTTVVSSVGILVAMGTTVAVMKAKAQTDRSEDLVAREIQDKSLLPANDNETRRQLQGSWIITDKRFQGNPRFNHYPTNNPHLKTWTLTNWAIVTYNAKSNVVYSASGPYEIHGDIYTETVKSGTGNMTNYIGTRMQYKLRVKGDRYYQMGSGIEETGQRIP
jgi:RNA polymerase sigma factor (sigma-70 family)